MNWDSLLSGIRLRDGMVKDRTQYNEYDLRNDFDDDYGRLIFSSAVRRLQDKAQVFPLDNSDFVRTRLTHSHEVSTIGRSIGVSVEENLIRKGDLKDEHRGKISALLAIVGLIHDLGNPPYGHFGEAAIQKYFKSWFDTNEGKVIEAKLGEQRASDFTRFEGNAQTFRLLSKLNNLKDEYGYNLSAATLASILKYPRSSIEGNKKKEYRKEKGLGVSYKKFGYLQSEEKRFLAVKEHTGIDTHRHPVTFLLEAADDIAYSAADIEDGCKKKVLDYHTIENVLKRHLQEGSAEDKAILDSFISTYNKNLDEGREDRLDNAVQCIRIQAQGYMIKSVVKEFILRHDAILNGEFDDEIIEVSDAANVRKVFADLAGIIFDNKEIIMREYTGGKVIRGLLEMFVSTVVSDERNNSKTEEGKLYLLISDNYRDIMKKYPTEQTGGEPSLYDRLLLVTDFVCGMTDSYALDLYRKLTGIKL
ncbi:deoxyguanosinetriphosphate triphosphohydrolase [Paenibacillus wynnii]|uniref:Deoxyguanosinetriphosphate triphosphohydrolase n=2 Tax=Paenibacillus wynnii TaxID=268407 RepID=A0A098M9B7_9BACL|nr:deoxyguanosinetriphosphate triphosphohydrolase [Paenibacillus wynnii]